jgi:hypothetical protein
MPKTATVALAGTRRADAVEASSADRLAEYEGHPSVRDLVADGYEVITDCPGAAAEAQGF